MHIFMTEDNIAINLEHIAYVVWQLDGKACVKMSVVTLRHAAEGVLQPEHDEFQMRSSDAARLREVLRMLSHRPPPRS